MKLFIRNILLFFLPIFLISLCVLPFYIVAFKSGELNSLQDNIEAQRENPQILLGMGYNEQTACYKLNNANYYQAYVMALGTSRVMQFKEECFTRSFYNCGGAVGGNYNEYKNFLENLSYNPDILILGLDSWVFNDAWNSGCADYKTYQEIQEIDRHKIAIVYSLLQDWISGKWDFSSINNYDYNLGFNGKIRGSGFRCDGSYFYGQEYRDPEEHIDWNFTESLDRMSQGIKRFEYGSDIDQDTIDQLRNLLEYCKENNIYVIGFAPPPCAIHL